MTNPALGVVAWSTERFELAEGARWTGDRLYLVDILAGRLLVIGGDNPGIALEVARVSEPLGAVAPLAGQPGAWLAAVGPGIAVLRPSGALEWLGRPEAGGSVATRMNDAAADPAGRFWAGSMAYDATPGAGSLYRVDLDGTVRLVLDGLTIPNGPAFSADGKLMYLADSGKGTIDRFAVDPLTGEVGAAERFAEIDDIGAPDGMTLDDDGGLWVAIWGAGAVRRFQPNGNVDRDVRVPARQPASVCLGGRHGRRLFIATATIGLDDLIAGDGVLYACDVEVAGPPARSARVR